jgi:predicted Zn-dependent protease
VEPGAEGGPGALWDQRWLSAIEQALSRWQAVLPITRVEDPEAAQVRVLRRRPPLRREASGRTRASHGRALLEVVQVDRGAGWRLEPRVQVLISPGQRAQATEATALHELGHAFGLWGHSDDAADAMAAVPGARPVLELSPRDRATLRWLYGQPTRFGQPLPQAPAESP